MMASRADVSPGEFKERNNEVGSRVFVRPELVSEILVAERRRSLPHLWPVPPRPQRKKNDSGFRFAIFG